LTVRIRYFARLKQEAGTSTETVETNAATVANLWTERASAHGFTLEAGLVRAAQNDEFCPWEAPLVPGTEVVFMPPVAGG